MTIRSRHTRRDWWPAQRIAGLKRYAFIGDSTMFGAGVAPDETLPAYAERLLNEALPGWPVEAVNYGVAGYNLWNSWIAIKPLLPLFDGLVLALCNNDAEMFSRSYNLFLPDGAYASWNPQDPFGAAAAACFADIAHSCKEIGLPVMVLFSNVTGGERPMRINEIIAGHCAANGLDYIHTLPLYGARQLAKAQLVVSRADFHPSALAHELAARHLTAEMTRRGWFRDKNETPAAPVPQSVKMAAGTMMGAENYPPDAALGWALRVLEAKTRVAKRRAALHGADDFEADHFEAGAAPLRDALQAELLDWHIAMRAQACALELAQRHQGVSEDLVSLQVSRLRLEELGFALACPEAHAGLARLPLAPAPPRIDEPPAFFAPCRATLAAEAAALAGMSDTAPLRRFIALLDAEAAALDTALSEFLLLWHANSSTLPPTAQAQISGLLGAEIAAIRRRLTAACAQAGWAKRLAHPQTPAYTTITIVLRTSFTNDEKAMFRLTAEYAVPHRLPFMHNAMFLGEPEPITLRFRVPLLYAGRIVLNAVPRPGGAIPDEAEIRECRISNDSAADHTVPPSTFHSDGQGSWISAPLFLV